MTQTKRNYLDSFYDYGKTLVTLGYTQEKELSPHGDGALKWAKTARKGEGPFQGRGNKSKEAGQHSKQLSVNLEKA